MAGYDFRHGQVATADVWTELTDRGSDGTGLEPIKVPDWARSIQQLLIVPGNEAATKTACGGPMLYRLSGSGVENGPHEVIGYGYQCIATGNTGFYRIKPAYPMKVDIACNPGSDVKIEAAADGTDAGTPNPGLGVVFSSSGASGSKSYVARFGSIAALSTSTLITGVGGGGTKNYISPGGFKAITRVWTSYGNELPLATAAGGGCHATFMGGLNEGGFQVLCGSTGSLSTTTGSIVGYGDIADTGPISLTLSGKPITIYGEQTGVDQGTAMPAIGLEMSK